MTRLVFGDASGPAALGAFLARQLRWDKAAVVRLRSGAGGVLAAFTRPARFEVIAVRTVRLAEPAEVDTAVAAGELLDALAEPAGDVPVPDAVTGPAWGGVLPPRGGWEVRTEVDADTARAAAASVVDEFRNRTEELAPPERTRVRLDALAEEIWSRTWQGTPLPLRALHAAHALGFLAAPAPAPVAVLARDRWLRLGTPAGSVALRTGVPSLTVTPLR